MKLNPDVAAKVGIIYFTLFSIVYGIAFANAISLFMKYHSSPVSIDVARVITSGYTIGAITGTTVFAITAIVAIFGATIWCYQIIWGDKPRTTS
jgi:hypothetical protein